MAEKADGGLRLFYHSVFLFSSTEDDWKDYSAPWGMDWISTALYKTHFVAEGNRSSGAREVGGNSSSSGIV